MKNRGAYRTLLATALAVAGLTLAALAPAANAATSARNVRRACAVTHAAGIAACMALIRTDIKQHNQAFFPGRPPVGDGYGPSDLTTAYDLPSSSAVRNVAVIDAYNDPNAVSDLATYRSSWGLSACNPSTEAGCLTVTNQKGAASPLPPNAGSTGWDVEESLDVDMVSAICPSCHIYLVEATSPTIANLGTAVNSAVSVLHALYVSNSYGAAESSAELGYDTKYYKHLGVAVTASAGDSGYGVSYPSASQWVVSVGGTSLTSVSPRAESVWSGTGSGCSKYEPKPSWQTHKGCSHRIANDVAADADPNTGVAIYDTYSQGGWLEVGGTSVSSPIIASAYALAGIPEADTCPAHYLYSNPAGGGINDITAGSNGKCSPSFLCTAEKGYDGPSGLGTGHGTKHFKPMAGHPC